MSDDLERIKQVMLGLKAGFLAAGGSFEDLAELQRQLTTTSPSPLTTASEAFPSTPKRRKQRDGEDGGIGGMVLAAATPSPKKRKRGDNDHGPFHPQRSAATLVSTSAPPKQPGSMNLTRPGPSASASTFTLPSASSYRNAFENDHIIQTAPTASTLVDKLKGYAAKSRSASTTASERPVVRSTGFSEKPAEAEVASEDGEEEKKYGVERDDRLVLVERLEMGPTEHSPPSDDPLFEKLEPNSGIALTHRQLPHEDFQDYLRGRYYISPSLLYSVVRLLPTKSGYEVPVDGDWVTVGVIAERGPIRYTAGPAGGDRGGEDSDVEQLDETKPGKSKDEEAKGKDTKGKDTKGKGAQGKGKNKANSNAGSTEYRGGKKYVNIKLIDFGARSSTSRTTKATIRGDAFLSLLLFESDSYDVIKDKDDDGKPRMTRVYKGGSRGAFEELTKLKEGSVIALLNPKILKPFQRARDAPHPTTNILAVTPESASSIAFIGKARDLGMCTVKRRDGSVCGAWCDKRVSENVCEWHVLNAVQGRRAGRAEFSLGTSGMQTSSGPKNGNGRKPVYDPVRKIGLKPDPSKAASIAGGGGSTYVFSGHIISGSGTSAAKDMFAHEKMGREGQSRAKRKLEEHATDRALQKLLKGDRESTKALQRAKKAAALLRSGKKSDVRALSSKFKSKESGSRLDKSGEKAKEKRRGKDSDSDSEFDFGDDDSDSDDETRHGGQQYSASIIKTLGFDPSRKAGRGSRKLGDKSQAQKTLETLASMHDTKREIQLGPRPGKKIRSGIVAPEALRKDEESDGELPESLTRVPPGDDEDSDDLIFEPAPKTSGATTHGEGDASSDLEIEPTAS